jgi:hypothetical protein
MTALQQIRVLRFHDVGLFNSHVLNPWKHWAQIIKDWSDSLRERAPWCIEKDSCVLFLAIQHPKKFLPINNLPKLSKWASYHIY